MEKNLIKFKVRLDEKYQEMYKELLELKKKQRDMKAKMGGKFEVLRNDFDEWTKQEPPTISADPSQLIYTKTAKSKSESALKLNRNSPPPNRNRTEEHKAPKNQTKTIEEQLLKIRKQLRELDDGEEVLAKWSDDGWYYRSITVESLGDYKYRVEDSLKNNEEIYREDILAEINDTSDIFEVIDK